MSTLTLTSQCSNAITVLTNTFIDNYMPLANGEFVKIYIYLLRCVSDHQTAVSVSALADFFNQTEADIMRALRYWDKTGAIRLRFDDTGKELSGIVFCDLTDADNTDAAATGHADYAAAMPDSGDTSPMNPIVRVAPITIETRTVSRAGNAYTPRQIQALSKQDDFSMLLYAVGAYMGGTLSAAEASTIAYLYDTLHFQSDLIEYLIEYCVSKGHKSMRYIEKVALAWAEEGITTVKEAKKAAASHNDTTYSVLNAFGIANRDAGQREQDFISKWTDVYCFDCDMIVEACNRTLKATHQPSFEYADSILSKWNAANIKTMEDIHRADAAFEQTRNAKRQNVSAPKSNNRFNNFHQRGTDIDSLESALISNKG